MKQTSYVMVKPQFANSKAVVAEIRKRLAAAGLEIKEEAFVRYGANHARQHYAEHVEKDFYPNLERYITSDKAYGMVVEGEDAIATIRTLVGSTKNAPKGTIRHDIPAKLGIAPRVTENVVHASDSTESAAKEIAIFKDLVAEKQKWSAEELADLEKY